MNYKEEFQKLLYYHGVKHFTADEVLFLGTSNNDIDGPAFGLNSEPPVFMWCNIVDTVCLVDELREHFGKPITILNGYRSEEYNNAIGGAPKSMHKEFNALDIAGIEPMLMARKLKEWRLEGRFVGGIGTYSAFVHVDTRGNNATWEG